MISTQKIKNLVKGRRIGKKAIERINEILKKEAVTIIEKAIRNADFAGRKTIKIEDIV